MKCNTHIVWRVADRRHVCVRHTYRERLGADGRARADTRLRRAHELRGTQAAPVARVGYNLEGVVAGRTGREATPLDKEGALNG